jgi:hypothetical protein
MHNYTGAFIVVAVILATLVGNVAALARGDIIIFKKESPGFENVYILHKEEGYRADLLWSGSPGVSVFDVDHLRNRIYLTGGSDEVDYLDLNTGEYSEAESGLIPEGFKITSVAKNGAYFVLTKPCWGDLYVEENPLFAKPFGITVYKPNMLFKYDIEKGEVLRLTFSHSQKECWVSDDGQVIAYERWTGEAGMADIRHTIIVCRSDGTGKYDLYRYLYEGGLALNEYYGRLNFALKKTAIEGGEPVYWALIDPNVYPKEGLSGLINYFSVALTYEADELKCLVSKASIIVPPDVSVTDIIGAYSTPEELFLLGVRNNRDLYLLRYDLKNNILKEIPNSNGLVDFLVY